MTYEELDTESEKADEGEVAFAALIGQKTAKKVTFSEKIADSKNGPEKYDEMSEDIWLIDSGASSHITNSMKGMIQVGKIEKK